MWNKPSLVRVVKTKEGPGCCRQNYATDLVGRHGHDWIVMNKGALVRRNELESQKAARMKQVLHLRRSNVCLIQETADIQNGGESCVPSLKYFYSDNKSNAMCRNIGKCIHYDNEEKSISTYSNIVNSFMSSLPTDMSSFPKVRFFF